MELVHTCGPAVSPDKNGAPSISDEIYFHPDKRVWYAGDDDGETRIIIKFCPYCGLKLSTLECSPNNNGIQPSPVGKQPEQLNRETGILDKNGAMIYAGDRVCIPGSPWARGVVVWGGDEWMVGIDNDSETPELSGQWTSLDNAPRPMIWQKAIP